MMINNSNNWRIKVGPVARVGLVLALGCGKRADWVIAAESSKDAALAAVSCGLAMALDTMQPCPNECYRSCGTGLNSATDWATDIRYGECALRNPMCLPVVGQRVDQFADEEISVDRSTLVLGRNAEGFFVPPGRIDESDFATLNNTGKATTYHRVMVLGEKELSRIGDPFRLAYASPRLNNRVLPEVSGQYCGYITVGAQSVGSWQEEFYPVVRQRDDYSNGVLDGVLQQQQPNTTDGQPLNGTTLVLDGAHLPLRDLYRLPRGEEVDDPSNKLQPFVAGASRHTPTIHALIQQWWLRYGDEPKAAAKPKLGLTYQRVYSSYSDSPEEAVGRKNEAGDSAKATFSPPLDTDTTLGLETLSLDAYGGMMVSPVCAERSNCAACLSLSVCVWCDMAQANLRSGEWFHWSKARTEDGSACGIPPSVCAMMGGEASVRECPVTWKDEWESYDKFNK